MRIPVSARIAFVVLATAACSEAREPAPRPSAAIGTWRIDKVGLGRAVDEAVARLEADMTKKLASVTEADRAVARDVGAFAVGALTTFRDFEMRLDVNADGSFTMAGADPVSHVEESGAGTWIDRDGTVSFTLVWKNGEKMEGRPDPMRYGWKDADTLVMSVPKLDVGIPLKRVPK